MMRWTAWLCAYLTRSFKPFLFEGKKTEISFQELDQLGLYVHIPFCKSLCSFCPYCKVVYDKDQMASYIQAVKEEIKLVGRGMTERKKVTSLYFGGGTPALARAELGEIIETLRMFFDITEGVGVELHPSDITKEQLGQLRKSGVTMISIGVQSFDCACLEKIGRVQVDVEERMQWVREAGFDVVDIDLIFGIPGQDETVLERDVEKAFALGATQISTYPFIDFTFANNQYMPMSHRRKKQMLKALGNMARRRGLDRTAVWTFARPDTQKYSSVTRDTFLGFGVSATTLVKDQFKINTFSIPDYIACVDQGEMATSLTLTFSLRQRAVYYLFWAAYSMRISRSGFKALLGVPVEKLYGMELWIAQVMGYIRRDSDDYVLTEKGAILYHRIEQVYTTAYIDKMWHISRTEAFPDQIELR